MPDLPDKTNSSFTLALPSKGALAQPTLDFFKACGLKVWKPNPRQYTGSLTNVPGMGVMFQRVKDVVYKVSDGTAQLGITGFDVVHEYGDENVIVIHDKLNYGGCDLLVAVPEAWVDVETMNDLADIAFDIRETQKRDLRVATTYTRSARQFLHKHGIHHFTLVKSDGAIEAAPTLGYADIVVDLTQTGTTLRENRLRPLRDGIIISSEACLVGNRTALSSTPELLEAVRVMLEHIESSLNGRKFYQLTANIAGESEQQIARRVIEGDVTGGLQGPSIARMYTAETDSHKWYSVTITVPAEQMLKAVEHLRSIGGTQTIAHPLDFVFMEQAQAYTDLKTQLGL
jgi:ATP phosphoribosyltransferase